MNPKERRDRLFKSSRPNIREMSLMDNEGYTKDMGILWGAYKMGSFGETTQEDFAHHMMSEVQPYAKKWLVEDFNAKYESGYGAVGMVCAVYNGWELEPRLEMFPWSTPRNTLRTAVSFLQMMRYNKDIGIVNIYSLEDSKKFFHHVSKYGVLNYATKIPNGDASGDRYIYYVRGKK